MYEFNVIGEKSIVEDKIQGRDEPYLYNVDHEPLEFTINIAFENYETIEEVTKVIKWLYNPRTYKELKFENMSTTFFAIFIGSPQYYYAGRRHGNLKEYIGYITCKVRTNAPYGYTSPITGSHNGETANSLNSGDLDVYPSFTITNQSSSQGTVKLTHGSASNGSSFTYLLAVNERLEFNGYTKTLKSFTLQNQIYVPSTKNPYLAWDKDYLIFNPDNNTVHVTGPARIITYAYRAPKYL
jgi:phage-related protein